MDQLQIDSVRRAASQNPLRKLLVYDLDYAIAMRGITEIPKTFEEFHFERGIREGMKISQGIIQKNHSTT